MRRRLLTLKASPGTPSASRFAVSAALVLLPAATLAGCGLSTSLLAAHNQGTIVVEKVQMNSTTAISVNRHTRLTRPQTFVYISYTESVDGAELVLSKDTFERAGFEQADAGDSLELYDPADNTIYTTTQRAWQAAINRQMQSNEPHGSSSSTATQVSFSYGPSDTPGRTSIFEQQLRAHLYRLAGRQEVDGRTALKLVATRHSVRLSPHSGASEVLGTVFVTPRTFEPIKEITRTSLANGFTNTLVETWLVYKVLPATAANRKLVSLTALHPSARVVQSATGYMAAQSRSQGNR